MRIAKLVGAFAVLCCFAAALEAWSSRPALAQGDPVLGDSVGPWGVVNQTPFQAGPLKSEGVQWVLVDMPWVAVERNSPGNYVWPNFDKILDYNQNAGFHQIVLLQLDNRAKMYPSDPSDPGPVITAIAQFAGAAAARYKGRGFIWEIGNEPDVQSMGGYWNSPATYTRMARAVARAIRSSDPKAHVAACATGWMDRPFLMGCFTHGLLEDGTIDLVSFHSYDRTTILPESGLRADVEWLRSEVRAYGPGHVVSVIDTEGGYGIVPFGAPKDVHVWKNLASSEGEQAAYLARHYIESIGAEVPIITWYKDMHGEQNMSLWYDGADGPRGLRPAGYVYRNLARLLPDSPSREQNHYFPVSTTGGSGEVVSRSFVRGAGHRELIVVLWNPAEVFDGKRLAHREFTDTRVTETWEDAPEGGGQQTVTVHVRGLGAGASASYYNLSARSDGDLTRPVSIHAGSGDAVIPNVRVGPMPTIIRFSM